MSEKEFRERIARIQRINNLEQVIQEDSKEDNIKQNNLSEINPSICGVKKTIENFMHKTKEVRDEER